MFTDAAKMVEAARTFETFIDQNFNALERFAKEVYEEESLIRSNISFALDNTTGITVIGYCDDGPTYYVIPFTYLEDPDGWMEAWRVYGYKG